MIDLIDPFMTYYGYDPDYGGSDGRRETENLIVRQKLVQDLLEGAEAVDTLLDCLEEQGVGADAYVAAVSANVAQVIDQGIVYVENESGILLPEFI